MRIGRGFSWALISFCAGLGLAGFTLSAGATNPAKGDRELGEYLSSQCTTCHQLSGKSEGNIPPIVGWPEDQFSAVMQAYKEGVRDNETMRTIAHRLASDEIEALAAFFGSLSPPR